VFLVYLLYNKYMKQTVVDSAAREYLAVGSMLEPGSLDADPRYEGIPRDTAIALHAFRIACCAMVYCKTVDGNPRLDRDAKLASGLESTELIEQFLTGVGEAVRSKPRDRRARGKDSVSIMGDEVLGAVTSDALGLLIKLGLTATELPDTQPNQEGQIGSIEDESIAAVAERADYYLSHVTPENTLLRSTHSGILCLELDSETGTRSIWGGGAADNQTNEVIRDIYHDPQGNRNHWIVDALSSHLSHLPDSPEGRNLLVGQVDANSQSVLFKYHFKTKVPLESLAAGDTSEVSGEDDCCFYIKLPQELAENFANDVCADPRLIEQVLLRSTLGYNSLATDKEGELRSNVGVAATELLYVALPSSDDLSELIPHDEGERPPLIGVQHYDTFKRIAADLQPLLSKGDYFTKGEWRYDQMVRCDISRKTQKKVVVPSQDKGGRKSRKVAPAPVLRTVDTYEPVGQMEAKLVKYPNS
jgi:hypothetical protein